MLLINKKVVDLGRVVDFCNLDFIFYNLFIYLEDNFYNL